MARSRDHSLHLVVECPPAFGHVARLAPAALHPPFRGLHAAHRAQSEANFTGHFSARVAIHCWPRLTISTSSGTSISFVADLVHCIAHLHERMIAVLNLWTYTAMLRAGKHGSKPSAAGAKALGIRRCVADRAALGHIARLAPAAGDPRAGDVHPQALQEPGLLCV